MELNEAYEILSDPDTKWLYDQHFSKKNEFFDPSIFNNSAPATDTRKHRRGSRETEEQKERKKAYAIRRNILFNRRMKLFSVVSLLLGGLIFTDHYLPPSYVYEMVYASFKPEEVLPTSEGSVSIFLNRGKKLELYPAGINDVPVGLRKGEALFCNTPLLKVMKTVQVGKLVLKPFDGLYNLMLLFGAVIISSLFVLAYKAEKSLVLPTVLTFFDNILVLSFFTMWYMERL